MSTLILFLAVFATAPAEPAAQPEPGALLIVGGGGTPDVALERGLALAGGKEAHVLVFPQASSLKDTGKRVAEMWKKAGAKKVAVADLKSPRKLAKLLDKATLIWLAGGDQNVLMEKLREAELVQTIAERRAAGVVIGGTSAGAAAMSGPMITGEAELRGVTVSGTELGEGLDLFPKVIVDQHFHRRRRFHRLLAAVADNPDHVGIGIDERTAIIVTGETFEVIGESAAMIIDARAAKTVDGPPKSTRSFRDIRLHNLAAGQSFDLSAGKRTEKTEQR